MTSIEWGGKKRIIMLMLSGAVAVKHCAWQLFVNRRAFKVMLISQEIVETARQNAQNFNKINCVI